MSQIPKIGIGVIVIKDEKILLGKRKNSHGAGDWSFPGGHLEFKESWQDCAKREVLEETGITIKNIKFATATNDIFEKENKHYVTIFMKAEYDSGQLQIMEPDKCDEWNWFDWQQLPGPLFVPIQNLLLQNFDPLN